VGLVLYAHRVRANKLLSTHASGPWWRIWDRFRKLVNVSFVSGVLSP
jgi:hypothetical protein